MNTRPPRVTTVLLQRSARALKRHLPAAVAGDDRGVHQARVATRRLREAVPVFARGLKGNRVRKAQRKIRRLTRALGTVRELDVTLRLLDELARSRDVPRAAVEDVRAHVIAERDRGRLKMLKRMERVDAAKLDRRLESVVAELEDTDDDSWRDALATRLLARASRLVSAIDDAGQIYAAEGLHRVRIASKKLRYGLEIVADSRLAAAATHVRAITRVQEMLGQIHDLQILQTHVAAVHATSAAKGPRTSEGLDTLARHIEDRCRHLHGRYIGLVPRLRQLGEAVTVTLVPQLTRGRRRRPLKMALPRRAAARAAQGGR